MSIEALRNLHEGQTASIVGRGPSILNLRARDFPPGPVITLNAAILTVRALSLPNSTYSFQKDGCTAHDGLWSEPPHPVCAGTCGTTAKHDMIEPVGDEIVLLSERESAHCWEHSPNRYVVDVEAELGLPWQTMSAPCAVRIASLMGCTSLAMMGHDAYVLGDTSRVEPGHGLVDDGEARGYLHGGRQSAELALAAGLTVAWIVPAAVAA